MLKSTIAAAALVLLSACAQRADEMSCADVSAHVFLISETRGVPIAEIKGVKEMARGPEGIDCTATAVVLGQDLPLRMSAHNQRFDADSSNFGRPNGKVKIQYVLGLDVVTHVLGEPIRPPSKRQ